MQFFSLFFIGIFTFLHLSVANHGLPMTDENDEYVVLYRGFHYTKGSQIPPLTTTPQQVTSPQLYHHPATDLGLLHQAFETMRHSHPYQTRWKNPETRRQEMRTFKSQYHWVEELYVNRYAEFHKQLGQKGSELDGLLQQQGITLSHNPFVSTTLDARTAVRYAMGICIDPQHRTIFDWIYQKGKHAPQPIGYVDIFLIPRRDLPNLGAFSVLEEFAQHFMKQPTYRSLQRDYTTAEEINVPAFIPQKYHRERFEITVSKGGKAITRSTRAVNAFMVRQIDLGVNGKARLLEGRAAHFARQEKGLRTFLYLLRHRGEGILKGVDYNHLQPELAKNLHDDVSGLYVKTYRALGLGHRLAITKLDLTAAAAIEHVFMRGDAAHFDIDCFTGGQFNPHQLAALLPYENLEQVVLGDREGNIPDEELRMEYAFQYEGKYDDFRYWQLFQDAVTRRQKPIVFYINATLPRDLRDTVLQLSARNPNITIKFKRKRNQCAAEAEVEEEKANRMNSGAIYATGYAGILERYLSGQTIEAIYEEAHQLFRDTLEQEVQKLGVSHEEHETLQGLMEDAFEQATEVGRDYGLDLEGQIASDAGDGYEDPDEFDPDEIEAYVEEATDGFLERLRSETEGLLGQHRDEIEQERSGSPRDGVAFSDDEWDTDETDSRTAAGDDTSLDEETGFTHAAQEAFDSAEAAMQDFLGKTLGAYRQNVHNFLKDLDFEVDVSDTDDLSDNGYDTDDLSDSDDDEISSASSREEGSAFLSDNFEVFRAGWQSKNFQPAAVQIYLRKRLAGSEGELEAKQVHVL